MKSNELIGLRSIVVLLEKSREMSLVRGIVTVVEELSPGRGKNLPVNSREKVFLPKILAVIRLSSAFQFTILRTIRRQGQLNNQATLSTKSQL
jgi:hypothetical protein